MTSPKRRYRISPCTITSIPLFVLAYRMHKRAQKFTDSSRYGYHKNMSIAWCMLAIASTINHSMTPKYLPLEYFDRVLAHTVPLFHFLGYPSLTGVLGGTFSLWAYHFGTRRLRNNSHSLLHQFLHVMCCLCGNISM